MPEARALDVPTTPPAPAIAAAAPAATTPRSPTARMSTTYLLTLGAAVVAGEALPLSRPVQDAVCDLVGLSVVVAILVGIRRFRPRAASAWYVMAAGQGLRVLADTTFNWQHDVLHVTTFPAISDAFHLLGYPVLAAGLALLVKGRTRVQRDLGPVLDTATVTAGLSLVSWVLLARPTIENLHHSPGAAVVGAAYPVMDILLVGMLVRLLSTGGGRSPAFRYLLVALTLLITADTLSVAGDAFATHTVSVIEYLWLLSYVAWGAAALHPSMTKLSDPVVQLDLRFRGIRLFAVVVATLIAPAILALHEVTGVTIDVWAVIVGSVVMFSLVVIRMNLAIGQIAGAHEALEVLQDELAVQATHDPLTGLANRTQSMRLLAGALGRARRRTSTVGLLFIDLDGFKQINDTHGHRSGDEVLRQVSQRMAAELREGDFVGRLGGDEFVVGIEDASDESAAAALANRLIAAISRPIMVNDELTVRVGASIGIAMGRGGETDVETLLNEADLAVYRAKDAGKGRAELFNGTARAALKHRNELERSLVGAMSEDELVLHYQPIYSLTTGRVECYETLVRWNRPGVGLLPPDEFLPVAESSDLICQLDTWVLNAAVDQLARWNLQREDRELQIAVNISGRHISRPRILADVSAALDVDTIDPAQLVLEVTETALMDGTAAAANLAALRGQGVTISLDDFGTGYHSSAQLSRLPIDVLKIDRHFVDASTASARSLLELMVKAAHAYGIRVVAEGVERQSQLDLVRALGCEYVQGYFLGRPALPKDLDAVERRRLMTG